MNKIEKEIDGYGEEKEEGKKGEEDGNGNRKTKTDPYYFLIVQGQ